MPLGTTDKQARSAIHLIITLSQRKCLHQQRMFSPAAACTVIIIVGIPVIHILPELTSEDTLLRPVFLFIITGPTINHIIMFFYSCRMYISSSYRTPRIRIFFFGNIKSLQSKIKRVTGFIQDRFPHQNRRMIAVTTDHFTCIPMDKLSKLQIFVPILPPRRSDNYK